VCNCSRKSLAEQGFSGDYPGICRSKGLVFQEDVSAVRFNRSAFGVDSGDPVVLRKEGISAYHIGSICDDIDYGITHVFRGNDLKYSTQIQKEIALAAEIVAFDKIQFHHHELLLDTEGQKLSKSGGNAARNQPDSLITEFARWMGYSVPEGATLKIQELMDFPLSII
jgi:glutamyl-tRNA synthetase